MEWKMVDLMKAKERHSEYGQAHDEYGLSYVNNY